jgi:hypothetical protein
LEQRQLAPTTINLRLAARRRVFTIPFSFEAETLGRITTLPSECTKNLMRSPG